MDDNEWDDRKHTMKTCVCCFKSAFNLAVSFVVQIQELKFEPPSHPLSASHLFKSSQSTELIFLYFIAASHYLFYTWKCTCVNTYVYLQLIHFVQQKPAHTVKQ